MLLLKYLEHVLISKEITFFYERYFIRNFIRNIIFSLHYAYVLIIQRDSVISGKILSYETILFYICLTDRTIITTEHPVFKNESHNVLISQRNVRSNGERWSKLLNESLRSENNDDNDINS